MGVNAAANVVRNLWAYVVIFCGRLPDGAEKFTAAAIEMKRQILTTHTGHDVAYCEPH